MKAGCLLLIALLLALSNLTQGKKYKTVKLAQKRKAAKNHNNEQAQKNLQGALTIPDPAWPTHRNPHWDDNETEPFLSKFDGPGGRYLKRKLTQTERHVLRRYTNPADPSALFKLEAEVGSGYFGKVYKATLVKTGEPFAIKTMPMDFRPEVTARELRAMSLISQKPWIPSSLPKCYGAFRNVPPQELAAPAYKKKSKKHAAKAKAPSQRGIPSDNIWMVLEWIEGRTLKEHINQKTTIDTAQIACIMRQLLETFVFLHDTVKIVHGDLIPQNIMIIPSPTNAKCPQVKLIDFGLSRLVGESQGRCVDWEMDKLGCIAYRMHFHDLPYIVNDEGEEERMCLVDAVRLEYTRQALVHAPLFYDFLDAFCREGVEARDLLRHPFLTAYQPPAGMLALFEEDSSTSEWAAIQPRHVNISPPSIDDW